jgi:hypothetical protein
MTLNVRSAKEVAETVVQLAERLLTSDTSIHDLVRRTGSGLCSRGQVWARVRRGTCSAWPMSLQIQPLAPCR